MRAMLGGGGARPRSCAVSLAPKFGPRRRAHARTHRACWRYMYGARGCWGMLRSFHPEKTPSHQNWEVNLDWAVSVLGREITWEPTVTQCFCPNGQRAGLPACGEGGGRRCHATHRLACDVRSAGAGAVTQHRHCVCARAVCTGPHLARSHLQQCPPLGADAVRSVPASTCAPPPPPPYFSQGCFGIPPPSCGAGPVLTPCPTCLYGITRTSTQRRWCDTRRVPGA